MSEFIPKTWKNYPDGGTPMSAAALIDLETRVTEYTEQEVAAHIYASPELEQVVGWMGTEMTDDRGERFPNGLRRWTRLTRPHGAPPIPGPIEAYLGQKEIATPVGEFTTSESSEEDTDDVFVNSSAGAMATQFLARYSLYTGRTDMLPMLDMFGRTLARLQWVGEATIADKVLRRGGTAVAASDGTTSAANSAHVGQALLQAFKATNTPMFLNAAAAVADYLMRLSDPNAAYAAYGVTPINRTVGGTTWRGFVDRITPTDKLYTTNTTWNVNAARFLNDFGVYTGEDSYVDVAMQARDFLAYGVLNGYDFFAVQTNLPTAKLNAAVTPATTTLSFDPTGPPVPFPVVYPFSIILTGETMVVTGSPGAGQFSVTRGAIPRSFSVGDMLQLSDPRIMASWPLGSRNCWNDHQWHRRGDAVKPTPTGTIIGTDQIEIGIRSLYALGYDRQALRDAYEHYVSLPHSGALSVGGLPGAENSDGGDFGRSYDSRFCWPGSFRLGTEAINGRPDRAYSSSYDWQGAGSLGGFKAKEYPSHFELTRSLLQNTVYVGVLLDKNAKTVWSLGATEDVSKRGTVVVSEAALALIDAAEGVV